MIKKQLHTLTKLFATMLACCFSVAMYAQTTVTGTVTDEDGSPLIGATVIVSSGSIQDRGTTTNVDGTFSIIASPGQQLAVSYIGYSDVTVEVTEQAHYYIQLKSDLRIDEVVVVGYGTQKKVNLTGSVATIDSKVLESRPMVSTSAALQGLAPGVTVTTQSGAPGADGGTIRIRGINSFGGSSTDPLVLIDGIEGSLASVEPNLIENISILKDAASASIYGSRAANGVILVTTKRSSKDRFSLNYRGYVGWQKPTMLPETVNAVQYRELHNVIAKNDGKADNELPYDLEELELYRKNMGKDVDLWPNTDWQDAVLTGSGFTHNHNVTLTVGTDRISMLTSLGYANQEGIIKNTDYERYSFRHNADVKFTEKLSMRLDLSASSDNRRSSPYQSTIFNYMNTRSADIPNQFSTGFYNGLGMQGNNPVALMLYGGTNKANNVRLVGAISLTFKPVEWLSLEGKLAPRYTVTSRHNYKKSVETVQDMNGISKLSSIPYNTLTSSNSRTFYGNYNFLVTAGKNFGGHDLKLILGSERNTYDYQYLSGYRENFFYPEFDQLDVGELDNLSNNGRRYQWVLQSYFGRINYNYKERYLLEANLRIDGSSRFAKHNRWGYFPSVSAGWRISEEAFMRDAKHVIDGLKLRVSYGSLGSQNLSGRDEDSYYPSTEKLAMGHISMNDKIYPIVTSNTLANPDIKWETTTMFDVGVDFTLFGKLNVTADWYHKITDGILMTLDVSPIIGKNPPFQNAGKVRNVGWDLSVSYANRWRDFSFGVTANLSDVKNEILDMGGMTKTSGVMRNQEGYAIGSIFALQSLGIIQTQEDADWINANAKQFNANVKPGDIRYADITDDNKVTTEDDRIIIGSTIPRYTYSMSLNFGWKGLRLDMMFQGVGKVDGYLNYYYVMPSYQGGTFRKEHLDYWSETNPGGKTPRLTTDSNNWNDSSFWMKSASYLRLKNLQIGYEMPRVWTQKVGIKSAFVYVNAQNLFTITNFWQGYDPEVAYGGSSGSDYDAVSIGGSGAANNYPQVKVYTIGLDLKF